MNMVLAVGARTVHSQGYWNHAKTCELQKKTWSSYRFTGPNKIVFKVPVFDFILINMKKKCKIMMSQRCSCPNPQALWICCPGRYEEGNGPGDGDDCELSTWAQHVASVFKSRRPFPAIVSERERCENGRKVRKMQHCCLENGRWGPWAKECGQGNGSSPRAAERNTALPTPSF